MVKLTAEFQPQAHGMTALDAALGAPCPYCALPMEPPHLRPTRDHILPRSRGGNAVANNVLVACYRCNNEKGHMTLGEWLLHLAVRRDVRTKHVVALIGHFYTTRDTREANTLLSGEPAPRPTAVCTFPKCTCVANCELAP